MNETDHLFPSSYAPNTSASFILIEIRGEMSDLPFADLCGSAQAPLAAIKLPGTLQLAALAIEDCQFAALLLLDCTSQVTVDACHDCILFIGPCKGSVFIRDCSNCTIFIVSRQLRFRGCSDCRVFPFTASGPIIESSSNMVFQCFGSSYLGLLAWANTALAIRQQLEPGLRFHTGSGSLLAAALFTCAIISAAAAAIPAH
ncbi:tubulin binding cofactor C-domain-containing protein [Blastocladiella britannica]|nr:tubulin binding cofactor C-domain-containing protein [Blastocladiella britannica]